MGIFSRQKSNRVKPAAKRGKGARKPALGKIKASRIKTPRFQQHHLALAMRPFKALVLVGAVGVLLVTGWRVLDRPIASIEVTAPFQRVTPMQVEDHVRSRLGGGILSGDLDGVRASLETLDWVDTVRIRRRWPATLLITVNEQVAAARWGERGLLNTRGELFVTDARHIPAELPVLRGPEGSQWQVAQRYLALRGPLLKAGLHLQTVTLDARGAWKLAMAHGIDVRLGRHAVDQRIDRFVEVVTPLIAGRTDAVDYVDLRYTNGFAIGWNTVSVENASTDAVDPPPEDDDA